MADLTASAMTTTESEVSTAAFALFSITGVVFACGVLCLEIAYQMELEIWSGGCWCIVLAFVIAFTLGVIMLVIGANNFQTANGEALLIGGAVVTGVIAFSCLPCCCVNFVARHLDDGAGRRRSSAVEEYKAEMRPRSPAPDPRSGHGCGDGCFCVELCGFSLKHSIFLHYFLIIDLRKRVF